MYNFMYKPIFHKLSTKTFLKNAMGSIKHYCIGSKPKAATILVSLLKKKER